MFSKLANGICAAVGAVTFVQFPAFFQQYLQRLGGHLDQSKADVERFVATGKSQGMELTAYIKKLAENSDSTVQGTAKAIQGAVSDLETNQAAYTALESANIWQQPLNFMRWFNSKISSETLAIFEPSLPFTTSALVYALIGILVGIVVLSSLSMVWNVTRNFFSRQRTANMLRDAS